MLVQTVKHVQRDFDRVVEEHKAQFRFFGNCEVGRDVSVQALCKRYSAVLFAHGAQADKPFRVPGADLPGVVPALHALPKGCAFAGRCGHADERCRRERPPLEERTPGHRIACWLGSEAP